MAGALYIYIHLEGEGGWVSRVSPAAMPFGIEHLLTRWTAQVSPRQPFVHVLGPSTSILIPIIEDHPTDTDIPSEPSSVSEAETNS